MLVDKVNLTSIDQSYLRNKYLYLFQSMFSQVHKNEPADIVGVWNSASFLSEISVKSPRKLFIFIT